MQKTFFIVIAVSLVMLIAGCIAPQTDQTGAEADLARAQAAQLTAEAGLVNAQTFSNTLTLQSAQIVRLVDVVTGQAQVFAGLILFFAFALVVVASLGVAGVVIIARRRLDQVPSVVYRLDPGQRMPDLLPQDRAKLRALLGVTFAQPGQLPPGRSEGGQP